ncbi:MAG: CoB--CoM heterodisulfide reductase iron-sulfur subunit A family protein [Candidatus Marinimicrobia bacterium]|nr:CoB--CoM heterodisulfide reductase iron-sulfur subunit A family protein [Candidatus Neomarinimicrobiota bacterium]
MDQHKNVLVIGAGITGMKACLLLANAGKQIYLVEKLPIIGGNAIKNEESFPNLECSTCMVAPIQQEILQHPNIKTMTLSTVEKIDGEVGNFTVIINKKARYVSDTDCIGCDMCFEPCPVSISNEWEENLMDKKAIYVPCSGSLPNVPTIDTEHCYHFNGKQECNACVEACMFGAIDFDDKDEKIEIQAGAVVIATGSDLYNVSTMPQFGYGTHPGIYTSMEFERLFASNGPTSGELTIRNSDKKPGSVAIIHCVGRKEQGYCSGICCMYSVKHAHFIKHKLPEAKIYNLYTDICVPDKTHQTFVEKFKDAATQMIYHTSMDDLNILHDENGITVEYIAGNDAKDTLNVDMVILASAMISGKDFSDLSKMAKIDLDENGFFLTNKEKVGSIESTKPGIFIAGCAESPKDIQTSVIQAEAAVGSVMTCLE